MNDNRLAPDDPIEWLNRARSNLTQAQTRVAGVYLEDLCFAVQQAAEKATKAVLIYLGINFPYTHDMTGLLSLIEQGGQKVPHRQVHLKTAIKGSKVVGVSTKYRKRVVRRVYD